MSARCLVVCAVALCAACSERPALLRIMEARQLALVALTQLAKSSDASNRAVMAETDEQAASFVAEANQARHALDKEVDALRALLRGAGFEPEQQRLADFERAYASYRNLDTQILVLAVENTNPKARVLSFGAASGEAETIAASLDALRPKRGVEWQFEAQKARAIAAVQRMLALEAPHIEAADDAAMDAIERQMNEADSRAGQSLNALREVAAAPGTVDAAVRHFSRFKELHAQVLALSRRNTDVRSLALVLNDKGKQFVACERALTDLGAALQQREAPGAR